MQKTRIIRLKLLTQSELFNLSTSARTFGELKAEISGLEINWGNTILIDKATKTHYVLDEAVLPAVDSIMYVMPTQTKSGLKSYVSYAGLKDRVKKLYHEGVKIPFNYTHATCAELYSFLEDYDKSSEELEGDDFDIDYCREAESTTVLSSGTYILIPGETYVFRIKEDKTLDNLVDKTTLQDLQTEMEELSRKLRSNA